MVARQRNLYQIVLATISTVELECRRHNGMGRGRFTICQQSQSGNSHLRQISLNWRGPQRPSYRLRLVWNERCVCGRIAFPFTLIFPPAILQMWSTSNLNSCSLRWCHNVEYSNVAPPLVNQWHKLADLKTCTFMSGTWARIITWKSKFICYVNIVYVIVVQLIKPTPCNGVCHVIPRLTSSCLLAFLVQRRDGIVSEWRSWPWLCQDVALTDRWLLQNKATAIPTQQQLLLFLQSWCTMIAPMLTLRQTACSVRLCSAPPDAAWRTAWVTQVGSAWRPSPSSPTPTSTSMWVSWLRCEWKCRRFILRWTIESSLTSSSKKESQIKDSQSIYSRTFRSSLFRPGATEGIPGPCPPKSLLVPPKRELCPRKRGLCPEEINRFGATGVQIEAWDSQNTGYHPRIREQELFRRIWNKHRLFLRPHPRIHETSRIVWDDDLFFWYSPHKSWKFARFWDENLNLWKFFERKTFFFGLHLRIRGCSRWTVFLFSPHFRIQINRAFVPPSHAFLAPGLSLV